MTIADNVWVEKIAHSGAWVVSAFVTADGETWVESRTYYGYTRMQAKRQFRADVSAAGLKLEQ
jgi:hypothetical protein